MTHAMITHIDGNTMAVRIDGFDKRNERHVTIKATIKDFAGATYDSNDNTWRLSPLHLPIVKPLFDSMTVAPEVVAAYHEALRQMCDQLLPSAHRKGALGQHIAELMRLHANGIAAIKAKGYQPPTHRHVEAAPAGQAPPAVDMVTDATDPALTVWLAGAKNAAKAAERKQAIVAAKKRKKKELA